MLEVRQKEVLLNGIKFSDEEIKEVKKIFKTLNMAKVKVADQAKIQLMNKMIDAKGVAFLKKPVNGVAEFNLTQHGRSLLGQI